MTIEALVLSLARDLNTMLAGAVVVAVIATLVGSYLAATLHRDSGPLIVTVAAAAFLVSLISFRSR